MSVQKQIDEFTHAAMSGGKSMTAYGVMAIILGILAMLAPGLTGLSLSILLGLFVTVGGLLSDHTGPSGPAASARDSSRWRLAP